MHALTLGTDPADEGIGRAEHDGRTKAGKEERAAAAEAGIELLSASDWRTAEAMCRRVKEHPEAARVLAAGEAEVSHFDVDLWSGVGVKCRPDWTATDGTLVDLKSARDASPRGFARAAADLGYHLQAAHYLRMLAAERFLFVAVEPEPPHLTAVYELDQDALRRGLQLVDRALDLSARLADVPPDQWPGYPSTTTRLALPAWALDD